MKIGILTQPLHNNYGGLLQAYALQAILKKMGHQVITVDLPMSDSKKGYLFYLRTIGAVIKRSILRYIFRKNVVVNIWPTERNKRIFSQHTRRFVDENIQTTSEIECASQLPSLKKYSFDAYIVGSDQVWRPIYSPGLSHFFLNFLDDNDQVKRVSYAASFGVEQWEFTTEQTKVCGGLARKFDAISVREDTAVDLCDKYFSVKAKQVLDPTFLLNKEDYVALVEKDDAPESKGSLISYVMDLTQDKRKIIDQVSASLDLEVFMVNKSLNIAGKENNDCIFPPVTQWLRGFMDAEFVITDSFHGTVFAIIFNKPFLAIGNEGRGLTRFTSVLKLFDLESRLITSSQMLGEELLKQPIDWKRVNATLSSKKAESIRFLEEGLYAPSEAGDK